MDYDQQIQEDSFLCQKYQVIEKLGEGCFGKIYKVKNKQLKVPTALKLQVFQKNQKKTMLENQASLLQQLQGKPFVPKFYNLGQWTRGTYIEIELLGKDLNSMIDQKFSCQEISILTAKLFQSLSVLHNSNIIHQDIKPQNIMMNSKGQFVFIDFGISKKLTHNLDNADSKGRRRGFIGTPRYASIAAHKGLQQSKKDDLQSLMYNIAYLYFKKLPWLSLRVPGNRRIEEIKILKQKTANDIFQQMGKSFSMAFQYIKNLEHMEEPNYKYLIGLFKRNSTMIGNPLLMSEFGSLGRSKQKVIRRNSLKKFSLNPSQNYGKYLELPLMGKQGAVDSVMSTERSFCDNGKQSKLLNSFNSSGSKGFSMRAYNESDQITDDGYRSFEKQMNIDEEQDREPSLKNIGKFLSPLLMKNPFSNKD